MSFYTCDNCGAKYGFDEVKPYCINAYDNTYFCGLNCLYKWVKNIIGDNID